MVSVTVLSDQVDDAVDILLVEPNPKLLLKGDCCVADCDEAGEDTYVASMDDSTTYVSKNSTFDRSSRASALGSFPDLESSSIESKDESAKGVDIVKKDECLQEDETLRLPDNPMSRATSVNSVTPSVEALENVLSEQMQDYVGTCFQWTGTTTEIQENCRAYDEAVYENEQNIKIDGVLNETLEQFVCRSPTGEWAGAADEILYRQQKIENEEIADVVDSVLHNSMSRFVGAGSNAWTGMARELLNSCSASKASSVHMSQFDGMTCMSRASSANGDDVDEVFDRCTSAHIHGSDVWTGITEKMIDNGGAGLTKELLLRLLEELNKEEAEAAQDPTTALARPPASTESPPPPPPPCGRDSEEGTEEGTEETKILEFNSADKATADDVAQASAVLNENGVVDPYVQVGLVVNFKDALRLLDDESSSSVSVSMRSSEAWSGSGDSSMMGWTTLMRKRRVCGRKGIRACDSLGSMDSTEEFIAPRMGMELSDSSTNDSNQEVDIHSRIGVEDSGRELATVLEEYDTCDDQIVALRKLSANIEEKLRMLEDEKDCQHKNGKEPESKEFEDKEFEDGCLEREFSIEELRAEHGGSVCTVCSDDSQIGFSAGQPSPSMSQEVDGVRNFPQTSAPSDLGQCFAGDGKCMFVEDLREHIEEQLKNLLCVSQEKLGIKSNEEGSEMEKAVSLQEKLTRVYEVFFGNLFSPGFANRFI